MTDFTEFMENGYILKRNLFSQKEISKLINLIERNSEKENNARETFSSTGKLNMTLWNHPSDDLFGKNQVMVVLIGIKTMVIGIIMHVFIQIWDLVL